MAQLLKNNYTMPKTRLDYSRSLFKYERCHSTNLLTGKIVPVAFFNLMPGDTPPNRFGFVLQSAPLLGPSFDNVYIDIISVWCPERLVFAKHNEWLGDNDTYAWTLGNNISKPKITKLMTGNLSGTGQKISKSYYAEHYRAPHFGCRYFTQLTSSPYLTNFKNIHGSRSIFYNGIQVIPFRMYDLIYNTLFRNENITSPILFSKDAGTDLSLDVSRYTQGGGVLYDACRLKNMFTMARTAPAIQTVDILQGITSPVNALNTRHDVSGHAPTYKITSGTTYVDYTQTGGTGTQGGYLVGTSGTLSNVQGRIFPDNLYAQLSGLTVANMYYSIMLQKYLNKASSGRRPVEFYSEFFGVKSSDVGHDDPQLLSQKRFKVSISRVPATANSTDTQGNTQPIGSQGAYSVTMAGGQLWPDFTATEYGMIQVFAVIRTQESQAFGIDRYLADGDLLSTYLPVFDHIGEIEVENREYADFNVNNNTYIFGYNPAWYWDRYFNNDVVGIMSPGEPLDYFTFARMPMFGGSTVVDDDFIKQNCLEFDRLLQFPVCYNPSGVPCDVDGEPYESNRYQWIIQFAVVGDFARTMSKDSEQLLF